jgi:hypothetical protein
MVFALACGRAAQAQEFEFVSVRVPRQKVEFLDGGTGRFAAWAVVRSDGLAIGRFTLQLADRTVLRYDVVVGGWTVDRATGEIGVKLGLVNKGSGPRRQLANFDAAIVNMLSRQGPIGEGVAIWTISGPEVNPTGWTVTGQITDFSDGSGSF